MRAQKRFAGVVFTSGIGILATAAVLFGIDMREPWYRFLIFLSIMAVSEFNAIPFNGFFLTMEFGFVYSSIFIFGPIPAAFMKALSTLVVQIYLHRQDDPDERVYSVLFNVGQYMLSFFGGIGIYFAARSVFNDSSFYEGLAQAVGIMTYFLANNVLVEYYLSLKNSTPPFTNFAQSLWNDLTTYLVALPAGILMMSIYRRGGFYPALFVFIPYMALVYTYRMYMNMVVINRELTALYDMAATMTSTLDIQEVLETVLTSIQSVAPWDTACLFVYQQNALVPAIYDGFNDPAFKNTRIQLGEGIIGCSLLKGKGEIVNNCERDPRFKPLPGYPPKTKSMIVVPLITGNELIGAITLTSNKNYIYTKKHLTLTSILASQAAVAISNAKLFDRTAQLAITDGLTKLYNYRYIYEELERQVNRVKCTGGVFSLIIIDIDYFKSYNDMYGHLVGDEILSNLAEVLKNNVRSQDVVGRYGGEEFAIILPNASSTEAAGIAERIRAVVEKTEMARSVSGKKIFITISAGVASYPEDALSVDDLVSKADKALLFGAKQEGRNKVITFKRYMS
jgi:diguanylate cyclase (GGDEF)-like protein